MKRSGSGVSASILWAAIWLPFLLGAQAFTARVAVAQTGGLPAPMSGDCTTDSTGVVTCTRSNGTVLAPSATTDATNAANISSGTLPPARLAAGATGTPPFYGTGGLLQPASPSPFVANAGPVKAAPFSVSALSAAGAATLGPNAGDTSFRYVNLTNGARLIAGGGITQVKTFVNALTGVSALYFEVWRVNGSGTFSLVGRSANLLSATTAGTANTYTLTTPIAARAGDYVGMDAEGNFSAAVNVFSATTAYAQANYPSYSVRNQGLTNTVDFMGSGTSAAAGAMGGENPVEVYLSSGPVVAWMGDSKSAGTPTSGAFLQAGGFNGTWIFPMAPVLTPSSTGSGTAVGTSLIDPGNQPCTYLHRTLGYSCATFGAPGATTSQLLGNVLPAVLLAKPAVLVVSGSINDALGGLASSVSMSNYQSIYTQAVAAHVQRVIFTGVEPATLPSDGQWSVAESTNAALKSFCQTQVNCVWAGDAIGSALGQFRPTGPVGNTRNIQPAYLGDALALHWNNAGAQQVGQTVANAMEPPSPLGSNVAVAQQTGSRVRAVVPLGADGTLGWRWQDTQDVLRADPQMLEAAPATPGTGLPGQQSVGCVAFLSGKGYVRCDGQLAWNVNSSTLTATSVAAANVSATSLTANSAALTAVSATNLTSTNISATNANASQLTFPAQTTTAYGVNFGDSNLFRNAPGSLGVWSNVNAPSVVQLRNFSSGPGAYTMYQVQNDLGFTTQYLVTGSNWSPVGIFQPNMAYFGADPSLSGGFVLGHAGPYPMKLMYNGAIKAALQNGLSVGSLTDPGAGAVGLQHLVGQSATPAATAGAAAAACGISGTDLAFTVSCTTGSAPAAGTVATVNFAGAYGAAPRFVAPGAANAASAAASSMLYASTSTTALTLSTANALAPSTSYAWHFVLIQ